MISWHRFYDASTGRYISADPIGLAGGMNLYAYANQNPITYIDPEGLDAVSSTLTFIGWGIALVEPSPLGEIAMAAITAGQITNAAQNQMENQYGGYKPGKGSDVPKGSNLKRRDRRKINSQMFKDFLRSQNLSTKGWQKWMETWVTPCGQEIERHFWTNGSQYFYHL